MNKEEYGINYYTYLIEQYKICIEMADRISHRRTQNNRFFITLLSMILAFTTFAVDKLDFKVYNNKILLYASLLGLLLCLLWVILIWSYKRINCAKYTVINEIEQMLPVEPFKKEWELLGQGKNITKYIKLSIVELVIPIALSLPYWILLYYSIRL